MINAILALLMAVVAGLMAQYIWKDSPKKKFRIVFSALLAIMMGKYVLYALALMCVYHGWKRSRAK